MQTSTIDTDVIFPELHNIQKIQDFKQLVMQLDGCQVQLINGLNNNVNRIAIQPVICPAVCTMVTGAPNEVCNHLLSGLVFFFHLLFTIYSNIKAVEHTSYYCARSTTKRCKAYKNPKDVWTLWKEYEFGLGGQKVAKDLHSQERGSNK